LCLLTCLDSLFISNTESITGVPSDANRPLFMDFSLQDSTFLQAYLGDVERIPSNCSAGDVILINVSLSDSLFLSAKFPSPPFSLCFFLSHTHSLSLFPFFLSRSLSLSPSFSFFPFSFLVPFISHCITLSVYFSFSLSLSESLSLSFSLPPQTSPPLPHPFSLSLFHFLSFSLSLSLALSLFFFLVFSLSLSLSLSLFIRDDVKLALFVRARDRRSRGRRFDSGKNSKNRELRNLNLST